MDNYETKQSDRTISAVVRREFDMRIVFLLLLLLSLGHMLQSFNCQICISKLEKKQPKIKRKGDKHIQPFLCDDGDDCHLSGTVCQLIKQEDIQQ